VRFSPGSFSSFLASLLLLTIAPFLTSCSAVRQQGQTTVHLNLQGRAMGGEQPITAATIQLYAVGTSTDGGASTALINQTNTPVTTSDGSGVANSNANASNNNNQMPAGYFTITGDYTCPSASTLVYIVGIGGNPGAGTNNVQEEMAAIGQCGSLTAQSFLVVNEITTVGTARALSSYMTGYASVGSTTAHAAALATAFNTASEYVQIANGTAPGPNLPSGYNADDNDLRALANVVQSCVNSNGSTANGSRCGTFFQDAQGTASTVPGDTVTALLDIFADPTNNVATIFALQGTTPAFAPTNASAPPDWTLPILQIPSTPSISPKGGSFNTVQSVTITDSDTDATNAIYYTTDGSTPSATNGTLYAGPFTVSSTETINAVDIDDSHETSAVASATFTLSGITAPTVSLSAVTAPSGSTIPATITATGNDNGAVVTFGVTGSATGSYSPATCTIANGSCSVSYLPTGSLASGTYANDLAASFAAYGSYTGGSATSTLTIGASPSFSYSELLGFTGSGGSHSRYGSPIQGSDGYLYGTTQTGGTSNLGVVYKVKLDGTGYTVLHNFSAAAIPGTSLTDGKSPYSGLVQGTDGYLYGTTEGGAGASAYGTIFKVSADGTTYTQLHAFSGATIPGTSQTDGKFCYSSLVQGTDGYFYGTTEVGGAGGYGTIFKISADGSTYIQLHAFTYATIPGTSLTDGQSPYAALVQGTDGYFYGTTCRGGATNNDGTIFKISADGSTYAQLYAFTGLLISGTTYDGRYPAAGLIQGSDGYLYGTNESSSNSSTAGTVFKISTSGANYSVLHDFSNTGADGQSPYASVFQGSDGYLYGTTYTGGANSSYGSIYRINTSGRSYTQLYSFTNGNIAGTSTKDGYSPFSTVLQASDGSFYGATYNGGPNNPDGILYRLAASPAASAPVTLAVPASVTHSMSFTLSYAVANAYSKTLQTCTATNTAGDTTGWTGTKAGSATVTNVTLTAPATTGTYTYALTCGGVESGFATLTVQ